MGNTLELAETSAHVALVAALCRNDEAAFVRQLDTAPLNEPAFNAFISDHQLAGLLWWRLESSAARQGLPASTWELVENRVRNQVWRSGRCAEELARLSAAFSEANVDLLTLKGLALSVRYYGASERRLFWDLDLLIQRADVAHALRILHEHNFIRATTSGLSDSVTTRVTHAMELTDGKIRIDLHWTLNKHPSFRVDHEAVWANSESIEVNGQPVTVLSPEHELAFCLTSAAGDVHRHRLRLRSFVDVHRMITARGAERSWAGFLARREPESTAGVCEGVLRLFYRLLEPASSVSLDTGTTGIAGAEDGRRMTPTTQITRLTKRKRSRRPSRDHALRLLMPSALGLRGKLWAAGLHEGGRARYLAGWMLAAPLRIMAHGPAATWQRMTAPLRRRRNSGVDVRFIATSNRPLSELACGRGLRLDLFHRIAAFVIHLPPLRERPEDTVDLTAYFLLQLASLHGAERKLAPGGMDLLLRHPLPGNARELRNVLLRAYASTEGKTISSETLEHAFLPGWGQAEQDFRTTSKSSAPLRTVIRDHLRHTLAVADFNLSKAARILEIPRSTLQHYLNKYEVDTNTAAASPAPDVRLRSRG